MIRKVTSEDINELEKIEKSLFIESPWPREQFEYEIEENPFANLYVYQMGNEIIGYIDYWIVYEQAQIASLGIRKEYRRQGKAKELLDFATKDATQKGCENITLEVRDKNEEAIRLYESCGFINAAKRKHYYENGDDAYLMIKPIGGMHDNDLSD